MKKKFKSTPFNDWCPKLVHGFQGKPKDKIFMGVEIELEYDGNADLVNDYIGYEDCEDILTKKSQEANKVIKNIEKLVGDFAIIKEDGSLDNGIEIASAPASYPKQTKQWNKFFENMAKNKLASYSTCGMHVHVSKKRISLEQRENLKDFFNSANKSKLEVIAGRKENKYCYYNYNSGEDSKYHALNVSPQYTFEFRLFSAPKNKEEYLIKMQFVRSLLNYCAHPKYNNTFEGYKKFLFKNPSFNQLKKFIESKKL